MKLLVALAGITMTRLPLAGSLDMLFLSLSQIMTALFPRKEKKGLAIRTVSHSTSRRKMRRQEYAQTQRA
ncbi:hypothetical protein M0802_014211 [Mischocyttarus mexicanus]|nr:hypothetical protein M0802_014211 [Mischocyttarus mexicanus]